MILPYNSQLRFTSAQRFSNVLVKRPNYGSLIGYLLAQVIKADIELNKKLEATKLALRERFDFDLFTIFNMIDDKDEGFVNEENLGRFLKERNHEDFSEYFIKRLDLDMDGKLSYGEFEEFSLPCCIPSNPKKVSKEKNTSKNNLLRHTESVPMTSRNNYYKNKNELDNISKQNYMSPAKKVYKTNRLNTIGNPLSAPLIRVELIFTE